MRMPQRLRQWDDMNDTIGRRRRVKKDYGSDNGMMRTMAQRSQLSTDILANPSINVRVIAQQPPPRHRRGYQQPQHTTDRIDPDR